MMTVLPSPPPAVGARRLQLLLSSAHCPSWVRFGSGMNAVSASVVPPIADENVAAPRMPAVLPGGDISKPQESAPKNGQQGAGQVMLLPSRTSPAATAIHDCMITTPRGQRHPSAAAMKLDGSRSDGTQL